MKPNSILYPPTPSILFSHLPKTMSPHNIWPVSDCRRVDYSGKTNLCAVFLYFADFSLFISVFLSLSLSLPICPLLLRQTYLTFGTFWILSALTERDTEGPHHWMMRWRTKEGREKDAGSRKRGDWGIQEGDGGGREIKGGWAWTEDEKISSLRVRVST